MLLFTAMPGSKKMSPLIVLRFIWAVLILGELSFAGIVTMVLWPQRTAPPDLVAAQNMTIVATVMMLVLLPLAFVIRRMVYRPGPNGQITPGKYLTGNIIFYTMCDSVAMTGLIAMFLHGGPGGAVIVPAIAVAMQIVNYPSGTALS
jgi:hypothetical protein